MFELTCVEPICGSNSRTPVSLLVKKTIQIHNRVECYWAGTPTSSEQKCGWKNSGIEMMTTGFVSFGTSRETKDKGSPVDRFKETCFIKVKWKHVIGLQHPGEKIQGTCCFWLKGTKISSSVCDHSITRRKKKSSDAETQTGKINWYVHMMKTTYDVGREHWCSCVSNCSQKPQMKQVAPVKKKVCVCVCIYIKKEKKTLCVQGA